MKKTLIAAAALAFGSTGVAHAQSFQKMIFGPLSIDARLAAESEYVYRGKEHSDFNLQSRLNLEYALPTTGVGTAITADVFSMNPIEELANQLDVSLGAKVVYNDFLFRARWVYHTFPNQNRLSDLPSGGEQYVSANRPVYNRSNELYLGVGSQIQDSGVWIEGGVYYDINCSQLTYELNLGRDFTFRAIPNFMLSLSGFAGYVNATAYNGDQRGESVGKWRNDYAYLGASADISYRVNEFSSLGVGIRYAWNNDGNGNDTPNLEGNTRSNVWWGFWAKFSY
ncbi:MAG: hypothetical protein LBD01_00720 [Puniceicoccales bacterium]|jgi:hypothetical protein|nr:hypothetical protein [Puniceicoccales bacterium]